MLAGVSAADLALLLRGLDARVGGASSSTGASLDVAEWKQATGSHGFGDKEGVRARAAVHVCIAPAYASLLLLCVQALWRSGRGACLPCVIVHIILSRLGPPVQRPCLSVPVATACFVSYGWALQCAGLVVCCVLPGPPR